MIERIKSSIADKLVEICPNENVYDEFVAQHLKKGGFFIDIVEQDYKSFIHKANKSTVLVDISYFPKGPKESIRTEMEQVKQNIFRNFNVIDGFVITKKQGEIVDHVLHITFETRYKEAMHEEKHLMQTMDLNYLDKEES